MNVAEMLGAWTASHTIRRIDKNVGVVINGKVQIRFFKSVLTNLARMFKTWQ